MAIEGGGKSEGTGDSAFGMTKLMKDCFTSVGAAGTALDKKLAALQGGTGDAAKQIGPNEMLELQFAIGQYNTLVESMSNVTKSVTDSMKSVAQRAN